MGLQVSDVYDEWVWTETLATNNELGHDDGVVGGTAEGPNPPL